MDADVIDTRETASPRAGVLEASVTLTEPQARLRVRVARGTAGRAEARLAERSWAAKHYWQEAPGVMVYEFDEPLPPGPITLRIPFAPE